MKRALILIFVLLAALPAGAKNVDLVTLPGRNSVQLTIYNSEDITLVKETRYVTLKKGQNKLQFSWAGTLIDPTSVDFRPLERKSEVELIDAVFPGQKPQHLIWNIQSEYEGQVKVEVSYFTSGLTWTMDYVGVADPDEKDLDFRGYVRVYNRSGEEYEDAQVRLIVGKINLVDKIADLARSRGYEPPAPASEEYEMLKEEAARDSFSRAESEMRKAKVMAMPSSAPKGVVKEGVSEYFMFSVDGTETIKDGWSKRMRALKAEGVKIDVVYRMREYQYGSRPVRFYVWKNDEEHKLGDSPLPDGTIRVFRDNGKEGLSFMAGQNVEYVPIMADVEINLGHDDLVVYEPKKMGTKRDRFSFDKYDNVDGYDETQKWVDAVRNYRDKPIFIEVRKTLGGDVDYESDEKTELFDYRTTECKLTVKAMKTMEYEYELTYHNGTNKKQDRIKIK